MPPEPSSLTFEPTFRDDAPKGSSSSPMALAMPGGQHIALVDLIMA
jgi:hypothetical protein